jgi:hypothetical protein
MVSVFCLFLKLENNSLVLLASRMSNCTRESTQEKRCRGGEDEQMEGRHAGRNGAQGTRQQHRNTNLLLSVTRKRKLMEHPTLGVTFTAHCIKLSLEEILSLFPSFVLQQVVPLTCPLLSMRSPQISPAYKFKRKAPCKWLNC